MPKKKKTSIRKTNKKPTRPAKRTRIKSSSRKKKPVRNESQTAGVLAVEVTEVEAIEEIEQDSGKETEATVIDPEDELYPPAHGGSE